MLSILVSICEGFLVFRGFPALVGDSPSSCLAPVLRFGNTGTALCGRFLARVNGYGNGHDRHLLCSVDKVYEFGLVVRTHIVPRIEIPRAGGCLVVEVNGGGFRPRWVIA